MSLGEWVEAFMLALIAVCALTAIGAVLVAGIRAGWRAWRRPKYQRHVGVGDCWPVNQDWERNRSVRSVRRGK